MLNRRPGSRIAHRMLPSRCSLLDYAEVATETLQPFSARRQALIDSDALSFYDLMPLFDTFRAMGVDLARGWDDAACREAGEKDRRTFHANHPRSSPVGQVSRDKV